MEILHYESNDLNDGEYFIWFGVDGRRLGVSTRTGTVQTEDGDNEPVSPALAKVLVELASNYKDAQEDWGNFIEVAEEGGFEYENLYESDDSFFWRVELDPQHLGDLLKLNGINVEHGGDKMTTYHIVPSNERTDLYSAGWDGNAFPSEVAAQAALDELIAQDASWKEFEVLDSDYLERLGATVPPLGDLCIY